MGDAAIRAFRRNDEFALLRNETGMIPEQTISPATGLASFESIAASAPTSHCALSDDYKLVDQIEALGVPSLIHCQSLKITGQVHLGPGVTIKGDVEIKTSKPERKAVQSRVYKNTNIEF